MLDDETLKREAISLREELKNERQRKRDDTRNFDSTTDEDNGGNISIGDREIRSSVQVFHGTSGEHESGTRKIRSDGRSTIRDKRSVEGQFGQSRSKRRGLDTKQSEFVTSGSPIATTETRSSVGGNFQKVDKDEPVRQFIDAKTFIEPDNQGSEEKPARGRPRKTRLVKLEEEKPASQYKDTKIYGPLNLEREAKDLTPKQFISSIKSGIPTPKFKNPLTEQEARGFASVLKSALKDYSKYADQYLNYKLPTAGVVWSDLDKDEIEMLASSIIAIGKRNGTVAEGVRLVAHSNDYITTLMILFPRVMKTNQVLKQVPKRERPTGAAREKLLRDRFRTNFMEKVQR